MPERIVPSAGVEPVKIITGTVVSILISFAEIHVLTFPILSIPSKQIYFVLFVSVVCVILVPLKYV